jgi:hypothetical protein
MIGVAEMAKNAKVSSLGRNVDVERVEIVLGESKRRVNLADLICMLVEYQDANPVHSEEHWTKERVTKNGKVIPPRHKVAQDYHGLPISRVPNATGKDGKPWPRVKELLEIAGFTTYETKDAFLLALEAAGRISTAILFGFGMVLFMPGKAPKGGSAAATPASTDDMLDTLGL